MTAAPAASRPSGDDPGPGRATFAPPRRSDLLDRGFRWWLRRYMARHFHAVRLAHGTRPVAAPEGPLVVVLNHPSWWDPLVGMFLSGLFPERTHYAPMHAKALARYSLFQKLGFYPVEPGTRQGSRAFLRTTLAILSQPRTAVWITAQGRFADPRDRSARLLPGIGHIARSLDRGVVLPLALEYPFWDERLPEVLASFGSPLPIEPGAVVSVAEWMGRIQASLDAAQAALVVHAMARNPSAFETLLTGKVVIGGVYDGWRRLRARLRRERFQAEHGSPGGQD